MKDYNKLFGYKPYEGGAGPTERQINDFNNMLVAALLLEGVSPVIDKEEDEEFVTVPGTGKRVIYDRWGFCNDDDSEELLDQVDLNTAVRYFTETF